MTVRGGHVERVAARLQYGNTPRFSVGRQRAVVMTIASWSSVKANKRSSRAGRLWRLVNSRAHPCRS